MEKLTVKELDSLVGGISITGSLVTALSGILKSVFDIGRSLGTSLRRMRSGDFCEVK